MDNEWERAESVYPIDHGMAETLCRCMDPRVRVENIELLPGGLINSNYKVTLRGVDQAFLLRLYARKNDDWQREQWLTTHINDSIPVPKVYYCAYDKALCNHPFAIYEFLDGVTLDRYLADGHQPTPQLAREIGEALAWLHQQTFTAVGVFDQTFHITQSLPLPSTWPMLFLQGRTAERLGETAVHAVTDLLTQHADILHAFDRRAVMCHGDFRPVNIMVRDGRLLGIIDWEMAVAAPALLDISLFIRFDEQVSNSFAHQFIDVYQQCTAFSLPGDWRRQAKLMGLTTLLQMLGADAERPRKYQDLIRLINKTIAEWPSE